MKTLDALNSQRYFCRVCGIGPASNCTAPHVKRELRAAKSHPVDSLSPWQRVLIAILLVGACITILGLFVAANALGNK